jgi:hypothetical protein
MPATRKTPPHSRRDTTGPDPFNVDLTDAPMTQAMTALHRAACLRAYAQEIEAFCEEIILDGSELVLAEGQTLTHAMLAQGRDFGWRAQFKRLMLGKRGIDISKWNWRYRTGKDPEPETVPAYMDAKNLDALEKGLTSVIRKINAAREQRDQLYPALHERTKPAIEGEPIPTAKAS